MEGDRVQDRARSRDGQAGDDLDRPYVLRRRPAVLGCASCGFPADAVIVVFALGVKSPRSPRSPWGVGSPHRSNPAMDAAAKTQDDGLA